MSTNGEGTAPELFNVQAPRQHIQSESALHRQILYMKAWGKSHTEISEATGLSNSWISKIVRQSWFQKNLIQLMHEKGTAGLDDHLKANVTDAVNIVADLMHNSEDENIKARCAIEMVKIVKGSKVTVVQESQPLSVIEAETNRITREIEELKGGSSNRN